MNLTTLFLATAIASVPGVADARPPASVEDGWLRIDSDITLRRLVVRNDHAKGSVLFLHGFPETRLAFKDIALALGDEYEVHAFDWPGYGQSSRPGADRFGYSPADYARVLEAYIRQADLDTSRLTIYATDIGALPVLLLAIDKPALAPRRIIVGDFAPFDRPEHMFESLRNLKSPAAAEPTRAAMNAGKDEMLANVHRRDLPADAQYDLPPELAEDMARGWDHGAMSTADAFFHYYAHFTRDQRYLEANLAQLRTPVRVIWGERDLYIRPAMGREFAGKAGVAIDVLPGIGHFPHLQDPQRTINEVRASFR